MNSDGTSLDPPRHRGSLVVWVALAVIALLVLVYVVVKPWRPAAMKGSEHPAVGQRLTKLELTPLTGDATNLTLDDLHGQVTLINFWGTWCPPCRIEFPHLVELNGTFSSRRDFRLVSVSCPSGGGPRGESAAAATAALAHETEKFLASKNADFPTYADPLGISRDEFARVAALDYFSYPTTLLLDRDGVIRGVWIGFYPDAGIEDDMESLTHDVLGE